jgi:hydrogenase/urease accessory protein HupE
MSYVLFLLAGIGFGYAAVGLWQLTPLVFPLVLALGAFLRDGVDAESVVKLVIAIVVMLIGIAVGAVLDERSTRGQAATG